MKSKLKYKKKTKKPQRCIINISNIENYSAAQFRCNNFREIAYIHYFIAMGLGGFPYLNNVDEKQDYVITLNPQQIESIIRKFDKMTNLNPKSVENPLDKYISLPVLNGLERILKGE